MRSDVDPTALRAARERLGLTQHQLARLVGVAGGERISRWELGLDEPRPDLLVRLARVLDSPPADLLNGARHDLRGLRYCAGLSSTELAAAVHVSTRTYARWESGSWVRSPSAENLQAIARRLNVPVSVVREALDLAEQKAQSRQPRPDA
jgi:transcriptional regulator with XRE-family HTH domain